MMPPASSKSRFLRLLALAAPFAFPSTFSIPLSDRASSDLGTTVLTAQGPVAGTLLSSRVRQFLGVPYATAARWTAPSVPPVRTVTLDATEFGITCTQSTSTMVAELLNLGVAGTLGANGTALITGDACLTANIWAPSVDRPQGTAVMVWIYGGAFIFGTVSSWLPMPYFLKVCTYAYVTDWPATEQLRSVHRE